MLEFSYWEVSAHTVSLLVNVQGGGKKNNLFTTVRLLMWCSNEYQIHKTECIWKKGKSVPVSTQTEVLQTALMFSLPKL